MSASNIGTVIAFLTALKRDIEYTEQSHEDQDYYDVVWMLNEMKTDVDDYIKALQNEMGSRRTPDRTEEEHGENATDVS